ncbi:MAG: hypothetical protein ACOC2U_02825 [bacterium]
MYSKKEIEESLWEVLDDCLSSGNQDGSIINLEYDEKTEECTVRLTTAIVKEDGYIGFQGY